MSEKSLHVITICGSLRKGSLNAMLARNLPALAPKGMAIKEAPAVIGDIPHYNADIQNEQGFPAPVHQLADAIRAADGIIIVTPEYNFSVPGVLKNALDWLSRMKEQPFFQKPVALQSASGGPLGASRMQYHLRQILVALDAITFMRPEIFVAGAPHKFDEKTGELKDEPTRHIIMQQLNGFAEFAARVSGKNWAGPA